MRQRDFEKLYEALNAAQTLWDRNDGAVHSEWDSSEDEAEWHRLMQKAEDLMGKYDLDFDHCSFTTGMTRRGLRKLIDGGLPTARAEVRQ